MPAPGALGVPGSGHSEAPRGEAKPELGAEQGLSPAALPAGIAVAAARAASNLLQEILIRGSETRSESIRIKPLNGRSSLAPVFTFPLPLEVVVGPSLSSLVQ